jgi:hypothetical protein
LADAGGSVAAFAGRWRLLLVSHQARGCATATLMAGVAVNALCGSR